MAVLWLWLAVLPVLAAAKYLWEDGSTAEDWLPGVVSPWTTAVAVVLSAVGANAVGTACARAWTKAEHEAFARRVVQALQPYLDTDLEEEEMVEFIMVAVTRTVLEPERTAPLPPPERAKVAEPSAPIGPPPAVANDPWVARQRAPVRAFVRGVDRSSAPSGRLHPWVACKCGHTCRSDHFAAHVLSAQHANEFFAHCDAAEKNAAALALDAAERAVSEWKAESGEAHEAATRRIAALQEELAAMRVRLGEATSAAYFFENEAHRTHRVLKAMGAERKWCATAALQQELHEAGCFNDPVAATTQQVYFEFLTKLQLGEEGRRRGGAAMHCTKSMQALWVLTRNFSKSPLRSLFNTLFFSPSEKSLKRPYRKEFIAAGTPAEYAKSCATFFTSVGYPPERGLFGVCWDPSKITARAELDPRTGRFVNTISFNTDLSFNTYADYEKFQKEKVLAGYVMPILLVPLDPALCSAFRVVGLIPTNLKYTASDLSRYRHDVALNLAAAGFKHVIADGADNAAVHFKYMIQCARSSTAPVEIAGVVTLHLFSEEGASSPRVMMLDWRHGIKNASLMPFSMARLLTLGRYVVVSTFWITTQTDHKESGLLVSDVNIRDAMSVPAAKRRLNVAVRRCMAGHPRMLGAVIYAYYFACMDSAFDDRDPKLTPLRRCALAMDCMIFLRWWYGWIEAAGKTKQKFISMQTFNVFMVKGNMLLLLVLLFERTPALRARAFAPWLLGSNPVEELLSEVFAFEGGNTGPTFAGFMRILQRWLHQNRLLADPEVHLPFSFSKAGHCGTHYIKESGDQYVQPDYPDAAGLQALYAQRVALMRPVMAALGMAEALRDAGMWDDVPLEQWNIAVAAAESMAATPSVL